MADSDADAEDLEVENDSSASADSIFFIPSTEFSSLSYDEAVSYRNAEPMFAENDDPAGERSEYPILSPAGERFLFRKMNYLKFRASQLSDLPNLNSEQETEREEYLEDARAARDLISRSCYRLSRSIARNLATNMSDFEEMFGEANLILLKAIEKFDYEKGFRFSTYATHSIQRHLFRWSERSRKRSMISHSEHEVLLQEMGSLDPEFTESTLTIEMAARQIFDRLGECLDEREELIIRQRFQLDENASPKTLTDLAEELGLSSERVRQIQMIALKKLQDFFRQVDQDTML